ncbi:S-phase kinase-associated protein 1 [Astathelohania contejeani]|uniref:E3 ubiquitin ligase complex SCF subunit n=1 Tax=Astathelohania contejeani TaxID=164912 RepID=A0ABQ7HY20_9MICR|nr:S-phase kinase-associated protein 1 [Thelohania contejeani]
MTKIQSSEGDVFEVEMEIIRQSSIIKTLLDDLSFNTNDHGDNDDDPIPLPNVNTVILKKVIQWCRYHHHYVNKPTPSSQIHDFISSWEMDFFLKDKETLLPIIMAADYLDIEGLLYSGSKMFANVIKSMTVEEIRKCFLIPNDLTADNEAQILKETAWCNYMGK